MPQNDVLSMKEVVEILPSGIDAFSGEKDYVNTRSVNNNSIVDSVKVTYNGRPSRANMHVEEGCVLFEKAKHTHKVLLIDSNNCNNIYSTGFCVLKPKVDKIMAKYLYYYLNFNEVELLKDRLSQGATQIAINNQILYNKFMFPVPQLSTQYEIISKLNEIETVLRLLEQQKSNAKNLLDSLRVKIFEGVENYKRIRNIVMVLHRYPTFYGFKYVDAGIPVLKISNMNADCEFTNDLSDYDFITQEINDEFPKTIVSENDLVMEVRGAYIGKCALVPKMFTGSNISPNTIRISLDESLVLPEYFWHYTFTNKWKSQLARRTNYWKEKFGTITLEDIESIQIPIVPLHLQHENINKLKQINDVYKQFIEDLDACKALFQSALASYFKC